MRIMKERETDKKERVLCVCWKNLWVSNNIWKITQISVVLASLLFAMDYHDIPTYLISTVPVELLYVGVVAGIVIIVAWLVGNHYLDLVRIASENALDTGLIVTVITASLYSACRTTLISINMHANAAVLAAIISVLSLMARFVWRYFKRKQAATMASNLIDLKQLYENAFTRIPGKPILLSEKDVAYDLLERDSIVRKLHSSITHCQPEQSYVISLEGKWGSGKTTIINRVKQYLRDPESDEKEYIIVDDFDPWLYGTQDALLLGMLETIVKHAGIRYSPVRSHILAKELGRTVTESSPAGGLLNNLFYNTRTHTENVTKLKAQLSAYLRTQRKKVVFFIDNLDRANSDNVVFLFKLIGIVFDLPGIVYVLSFEEDRIGKVLQHTDEIDPRFTEKIIQQEIHVPPASEAITEQLYWVCLENLLSTYGIPQNRLKDFVPVARYIIAKATDIRMFKRMINSVFSVALCDDTILDKRDLVALELIQFFDSELYDLIRLNSGYFISHDRSLEKHFIMSINKQKFNETVKVFYDSIFVNREHEKDLLAEVFPYVNRYKNNTAIEQEHMLGDPDAPEISRRSRACNGKFFDLYFSYTSNNSLKIQKNVKDFVSAINSIKTLLDAIALTEGIVKTLEPVVQKEWIERLQNQICDINVGSTLLLAQSLYDSMPLISDTTYEFGMGLTPRSRSEYIVSELLLRCNEEEFDAFLFRIGGGYHNLYTIRSICYWMNSDKHDNLSNQEKYLEKLKNQFATMCKQIINEGIDIYADNYYRKGNAWGLYHYFKDADNKAGFTDYIKSIISPTNVYRVLWDIVGHSVSNTHKYSISEENMAAFGLTAEILDSFIAQQPPRNEDESFVLRVYEAYKGSEVDVWDEKGVATAGAVEIAL